MCCLFRIQCVRKQEFTHHLSSEDVKPILIPRSKSNIFDRIVQHYNRRRCRMQCIRFELLFFLFFIFQQFQQLAWPWLILLQATTCRLSVCEWDLFEFVFYSITILYRCDWVNCSALADTELCCSQIWYIEFSSSMQWVQHQIIKIGFRCFFFVFVFVSLVYVVDLARHLEKKCSNDPNIIIYYFCRHFIFYF